VIFRPESIFTKSHVRTTLIKRMSVSLPGEGTYIHADMRNYDHFHWQVLWTVASFGPALLNSNQVKSFQANSSVGRH
jgi:hypothetical protein